MKKLQITRSIPTHETLVEFYKKENNPKMKERYHALSLMHEFQNCTKVARLIKRNRKSIQLWVNAFNKGGIASLTPKSPPGRPSRLSKAQREELKKDILTHPRELGYEFSNWEGKNISEHLKNKFGVLIKVRQCQYILRDLGFSLQRPRYRFPKADQEQQKQFMKNMKKN